MTFYLKPTGSTCYNRTGITFPAKKRINFEKRLAAMGCKDFYWCNQFGWSNQPEVITFRSVPDLDKFGIFACNGFVLAGADWLDKGK